ncbi:transposase [Nostoc sp. NMS4]|uniref:transposase n=1 Tax=Nostoc sp. NMS4 TaxID=2815390 RepID=UPI0034254ECE
MRIKSYHQEGISRVPKTVLLEKKDPSFWTDAYCIVLCGGAPLEIVKEYIKSQESPCT